MASKYCAQNGKHWTKLFQALATTSYLSHGDQAEGAYSTKSDKSLNLFFNYVRTCSLGGINFLCISIPYHNVIPKVGLA